MDLLIAALAAAAIIIVRSHQLMEERINRKFTALERRIASVEKRIDDLEAEQVDFEEEAGRVLGIPGSEWLRDRA